MRVADSGAPVPQAITRTVPCRAPPSVLRAWITFTIPMPPSTNKLTANVPSKGRIKTAAYRSWAREAGWTIRQQFAPLPQYPGAVHMEIDVPRDSGLDIDNPIKAILDLLQMPHGARLRHGLGIIQDDDLVDDLRVRRVANGSPFTVRMRAADE